MFHTLVNIDVRTLIAVLFWGNLTSVVLVLAYRTSGKAEQIGELFNSYVLAKVLQAAACFCLFFRGELGNFWSVNVGNTLLLTGFLFEAFSMFTIAQEKNKKLYYLVAGIWAVCVIAFNLIEFFRPDSSIRVAVASVCAFWILVVPNSRLLFCANGSLFKRFIGLFYLFFLALLLPRAAYAFFYPIGILTNFWIQGLTFLSLVLLMIFSLSAYLLLMKENTDKKISTMATTDALTGLRNRYSFIEAGAHIFARHLFEKRSLSILFLDIDHFKWINDTHMHAFGDKVLCHMGGIIHDCIRDGDLAGRYGGEEFVVLLAGIDASGASIVAERITKMLTIPSFEELPDFMYTVSIGIMSGIPDGVDDTLNNFISKADEAMYAAKNAGRNRIMEY